MREALGGLPPDYEDQHDQRRSVCHRRQDPGPVVPVASNVVCRSLGLLDRKPGQPQGEDVRRHVTRVGEQGEGVGQDATGELDDEDEQGQEEGLAQSSADDRFQVFANM